MKDDLAMRDRLLSQGELHEGYHPEMEALHLKHAAELDKMIDEIGYPTINKVGREASDAAWLVIQHSISSPGFMRKCLRLLEQEVSQKKVDPKHLAYLSDRIAVFEGRPQKYGTQYDWDDTGVLSPNHMDDIEQVNQRRADIGLGTIAENTQLIRDRTEREGGRPPSDLAKRNLAYEEWRRKVGWIS